MSLADRCDEIVRLIDDALNAVGGVVPAPGQPEEAASVDPRGRASEPGSVRRTDDEWEPDVAA
jgi:hypothetical protein